MSQSTMVHVRINNDVKLQATKTLAAMGLSISDAVRLLLIRTAAEHALPFDVRVPNTTTVTALKADARGKTKRHRSPSDLYQDLGI